MPASLVIIETSPVYPEISQFIGEILFCTVLMIKDPLTGTRFVFNFFNLRFTACPRNSPPATIAASWLLLCSVF